MICATTAAILTIPAARRTRRRAAAGMGMASPAEAVAVAAAALSPESPDSLHLRTVGFAGEQVQDHPVSERLRAAQLGSKLESDGNAGEKSVSLSN